MRDPRKFSQPNEMPKDIYTPPEKREQLMDELIVTIINTELKWSIRKSQICWTKFKARKWVEANEDAGRYTKQLKKSNSISKC